MGGVIDRARGILGRKDRSSAPPPYRTRCVCGETIEGYRRREHQLVNCPACDGSILVLPRDPLPRLTEDPPARPRPSGGQTEEKKSSPRSKPSVPLAERTQRVQAQVRAAASKLKPPRHWFTAPKMIFVAAILLLVATFFWQTNRRRLGQLREQMVPRARHGLQELSEGNLAAARDDLQFAIRAIDEVGERVPEEQRYRQAFAELDVALDLLDEPLDEALVGGAVSPDLVNQRVHERAIVLDVEVEPDGSGRWLFHFLMFLDEQPVAIDPDGLELFDRLGIEARTRLIFGARIDGLVHNDGKDLVLRLLPNSGVLMTESRVFEQLGIARDPTAEDVRRRQFEWIAGTNTGDRQEK